MKDDYYEREIRCEALMAELERLARQADREAGKWNAHAQKVRRGYKDSLENYIKTIFKHD